MKKLISTIFIIILSISNIEAKDVSLKFSKLYPESFGKIIEKNYSAIKNNKIPQEKLIAIYVTLKNTPEQYSHQMNGEVDNQIHYHPVGYEVVTDKNDKVIEEGPNRGSYNFYNFYENPLKHYLLDIEPWIRLGNYKEDPTTIEQRITAFLMDIQIGMKKYLELKVKNKLPKDIKFTNRQIEVLALFVSFEEISNTNLFESLSKGSTKDIVENLKKLPKGFNTIYNKS